LKRNGNIMDRKDELTYLRDEHKQNRKYIFERALIITIVGVIFGKLVETEYLSVICTITVLFLTFNMWFIINRMKSSARIVAYINLFIEQEIYPLIGWEHFLSIYRKTVDKETVKKIFKKVKSDYASNRFLSGIWWFHFLTILIFFTIILVKTFGLNGLSPAVGPCECCVYDIVMFTMACIIVFVFLQIAIQNVFNKKMNRTIEVEERIIKLYFRKYRINFKKRGKCLTKQDS
jgi:hypothetical protein